jgi:hypothetical protein
MSKVLFFFNDLELPMIVHSRSNRPYFAQFVHGRRIVAETVLVSFAIRKKWWT